MCFAAKASSRRWRKGVSDMQGVWQGTTRVKLTLENGYDLFGVHGRVVGVVRFLVDNVHALGL